MIYSATRNIRRTGKQLAMGDVVGEGLLVEDAGAENNPSLPGCESASNDWDGGVGLAQIDTLLLRFKLVLKNDGWLVATALGAGHLKEGDGKSFQLMGIASISVFFIQFIMRIIMYHIYLSTWWMTRRRSKLEENEFSQQEEVHCEHHRDL